MCGINLLFGENSEIERMNQLLHRRGVRASVAELSEDLFLGHVRLPIQGLDKKYDHPLSFKSWVGAMVGEIFNYKDLTPHENTDLMTVLMNENQPEGYALFDGFWSIILFDTRHKVVHIITDHLAKKPLYYRLDRFAFSSEIKTLVELEETHWDHKYLSAVAKWGYCPEVLTPFKEIKKVPPGVIWTFDQQGKFLNYDDYLKIKPTLSSNPYKDIRTYLDRACKNRLVSDVPISLLMSGGVDSTIIYYLLKQYTDELTIFHIDNDEAEYLNYIDFRSTDKVIKLSINEDKPLLKHILYLNDGPVDLGSMVPQYLLSKAIKKQGFNVCLSGDGADELFGGYKRYNEYDAQYSDIFHELVYYHLPRLDKMMMANTIELRCPFLAPKVIKLAMALPYERRIAKNGLKAIFQDLVPKPILDRKKKPLRYRVDRRLDFIELYKKLYPEVKDERK